MAESALKTVQTATFLPIPSWPERTQAIKPVRHRTICWYKASCNEGSNPKGWTNVIQFFQHVSLLFELQPLAHFEILHPQYQNNFHTQGSGRAEYGPRGLVGQRKILIGIFLQVIIIFEKPCRVDAKRL